MLINKKIKKNLIKDYNLKLSIGEINNDILKDMINNTKNNLNEKNMKIITNLAEIDIHNFKEIYLNNIIKLNNESILLIYLKIYKNNIFISQLTIFFIDLEKFLKNKKNIINLNELKNLFIFSQKQIPMNSMFRKNKLTRLCKYIILDNEFYNFDFNINNKISDNAILKTFEIINEFKKSFNQSKRPITREIIRRRDIDKNNLFESNLTSDKCKTIIDNLIKEQNVLELKLKNKEDFKVDHNYECLTNFEKERKLINNFKQNLKLNLREKIKLKEALFKIDNLNKIKEYGINDKKEEFLNTTLEGNQLRYLKNNKNDFINKSHLFKEELYESEKNNLDENNFKINYLNKKLIAMDKNINQEYEDLKKEIKFIENIEYMVLVYENNIKEIIKQENYIKNKIEKKLFYFLSQEFNDIKNKNKLLNEFKKKNWNIINKIESNNNDIKNNKKIEVKKNNFIENKQTEKNNTENEIKKIINIKQINNKNNISYNDINIMNNKMDKDIKLGIVKIKLPIKRNKNKKIKLKKSFFELKKKGVNINLKNITNTNNIIKDNDEKNNNKNILKSSRSIFNFVDKKIFKSMSRNKKLNKNVIFKHLNGIKSKINNLKVNKNLKKLLDNSSKHLYDEFN